MSDAIPTIDDLVEQAELFHLRSDRWHGIGNQHDLVRAFTPVGDSHRGGTHMLEIGYNAAPAVPVVKCRADHAGLTRG